MTTNNKYFTPASDSKYLWLFSPNTKFTPVFSITQIAEGPEWDKIIARIEKGLEEFYATQCAGGGKKPKKCPYLPWRTPEEGGKREFCAKNGVEGTRKDGTTFSTKPMVVNAKGEEITQADCKGLLTQGTIARVGFTANYWRNDAQGVGVSARLNVVQIIKPVYKDKFGGFGDLMDFQEVDPNDYASPGKCHTDNNDGLEVEDLFKNASVG